MARHPCSQVWGRRRSEVTSGALYTSNIRRYGGGFSVQDLGFRIWDSGLRAQDLGLRGFGLGFRV